MADDILPYDAEERDAIASGLTHLGIRGLDWHAQAALRKHRDEVECLAHRVDTAPDVRWLLLNYVKRVDDIMGVASRVTG